jgi:LPS sulfotransferase NodH
LGLEAVGLEAVFPDFAALHAGGFAGVRCAKPAIMIAMTPRSGSTFLCSALHEAGQSSEPAEIFNPRGPAQNEARRYQVTGFADYIASFARAPDAAFIFKTCWADAAPLAPALTHIFPGLRVIYLERKNIAAQAVSNFKAEVSGIWHLRPGQSQELIDYAGKFDMERILLLVRNIEAEKTHWKAWFTAQAIEPLQLEYRLLDNDIQEALRRVAATMQLPLRPDHVTGRGLVRLADAISAEWTERVQRRLFNLG